ncbi:unnamed protein product [Rhodiola kirilowii]
MWQVLVAAAVAGSGLVARNIFSSADGSAESVLQNSQQQSVDRGASSDTCEEMEHASTEPTQSSDPSHIRSGADKIFRFSSSGSKCKKSKLKGDKGSRSKTSGSGVGFLKKGVEVQKLERRFSVCLKRRKTGKSASVDSSACWYDGNKNTLFGCGVGVGIMYMMSTGQAEISKLNATMDQTVKAVGELKNELCKRKSSCISKASCHSDMNTYERSECPSSILSEEPMPQRAVQEMDQLEADLEYELSKLTSGTTQAFSEKDIDTERYQTEVLAYGGQQICNKYQFNGVEPSVLDKKLSQLLIQQQEGQISELEYELQSANSKLHQKEAELRALKDCVRHLSNISLSNTPENGLNTETAEEMVAE